MATPTLATVGGQEFSAGYAGQLAYLPGGAPDIESRVNEGATAIDYGAPVCRGVATVPGTTGNGKITTASGIVIGFAIRALSEANTTVSAGTVNIPQYSEVGVLKDGLMWVVAAENATEGDGAIALSGTPATVGSVTGGAANGTTRLVTGAVWQQTVTAGNVGLIRVKNNA